ncbi:MAG: hypothetical protein WCF85_07925, partial [Rhodospirillaceae bacterium]
GHYQNRVVAKSLLSLVTPAKAGVQMHKRWIPAFAGMTKEKAGMTDGDRSAPTALDLRRSGFYKLV